MRHARPLAALALLVLLVAVPFAGAKGSSAPQTARAELRAYKGDHGWVRSASLLRCKRKQGRLVCAAQIKGRKGGEAVICAARVLVSSVGGRRRAVVRLRACKGAVPVELHVHVDQTHTRDPLDPFKVTYSYSVTATQEPDDKPVPVPAGVLAFYNDGKLECSVNVGPAIAGGICPVRYAQLGEHKVTTIFSSGAESVTLTEVEDIKPVPTVTSLSLGYADLPGGPEPLAVGIRCTYVGKKCGWSCNWLPTPGAGSERCFFQQEWVLGVLTVNAGSTPAGNASVRCNPGACISGDSGLLLNGEKKIEVKMYVSGEGIRYPIGTNTPPSCQFMQENAVEWRPDLTQTGYTAIHAAPGYSGAPVSRSITISPVLPC